MLKKTPKKKEGGKDEATKQDRVGLDRKNYGTLVIVCVGPPRS